MRKLVLPDGCAMVDVWQIDIDINAAISDVNWALLSADERQTFASYKKNEDQQRFAQTRSALRRILAGRLNLDATEIIFSRGKHGKPALGSTQALLPESLHFNVSHSGDKALVALSAHGAVGVDIEYCDPSLDEKSLSSLLLSRKELEHATACSGVNDLTFYQRWVAKEAVLKALGFGIGEYLQQFSVWPDDKARANLQVSTDGWPKVHAWSLDVSQPYVAAIALINMNR